MSRYSGKCDLADWVEISGGFYEFVSNNPSIYVGDSEQPLRFEKESELMPYYPYVVSVCVHNKDGDKPVEYIRLMDESWIDYEEKKYGKPGMNDFYRRRLAEDIEAQKIKEGAV